MPTTLCIDADACPVKNEAVRVGERHGFVIRAAAVSAVQNDENCASFNP